jgi:two-component system C4-dicarboxylate transport sensor histidine kinase DctB
MPSGYSAGMVDAVVQPRGTRPVAPVLLGAVLGAVYVAFDLVSEAKIRDGSLSGPLADAHQVIDHALPVIVGALLGVGVHYLRLRARLAVAEEAAARADALRTRLQRVERDQAVWVLAAAVLHELNNPLHALGLLLDELDEVQADGASRAALIAQARGQADRALSRLKTLRSMRSVQEPELRPLALEEVVAALAADVGSLAAEDGLVVRVDCPGPVRVTADPTYVRTILENLVDNSLQALRGKNGGSISIRLAREGGRGIVRVCDDGPPLEAAARASLFEPLGTTKAQGLGLGLPIARALARAMRGELALDDAAQNTFRLELPLLDAP